MACFSNLRRAGAAASLLALAACPGQPKSSADSDFVVRLPPLAILQHQLQQAGWDTPAIPREDLVPGRVVVRAPGADFSGLSEVKACVSDTLPDPQEAPAALTTIDYRFAQTKESGIAFPSIAELGLDYTKFRWIKIDPKVVVTRTLNIGKARAAIKKDWQNFRDICLQDFAPDRLESATPYIITETLVAKSIDLEFLDDDRQTIRASTAVTGDIAHLGWIETQGGHLTNDGAKLVFGVHVMATQDLLPNDAELSASQSTVDFSGGKLSTSLTLSNMGTVPIQLRSFSVSTGSEFDVYPSQAMLPVTLQPVQGNQPNMAFPLTILDRSLCSGGCSAGAAKPPKEGTLQIVYQAPHDGSEVTHHIEVKLRR